MVDDDEPIPSTRLVDPPVDKNELGDPEAWSRMLDAEDQRCEELGLAAGIVSIDIGVETRDRMQRVAATVMRRMKPTDRVCRLSEHELGILLIPRESLRDIELWAADMDHELRRNGMVCDIGFAPRRADGLHAASARADALAATSRRHHELDLR